MVNGVNNMMRSYTPYRFTREISFGKISGGEKLRREGYVSIMLLDLTVPIVLFPVAIDTAMATSESQKAT